MSRIFGGSSTSSTSQFDIRLNNNHVFLRGDPGQAPGVLVKGSVVLRNTESVRVQAVRILLICSYRIAFTSGFGKLCKHEDSIVEKRQLVWEPTGKQTNLLSPGNYDWPFELVFDGGLMESLEGPQQSWITYKLKAVAERPVFMKDFVQRKHLRVIRTVDPESLELLHEMIVENVWPEKIKYSFSTPFKGVMYGSTLACFFALTPLLKGLKIGKIETQLWEERKYALPRNLERSVDPFDLSNWNEPPRKICEDIYELPDDTETEDVDGMEGYKFSRSLLLPRNMKQCTQSVNLPMIKIEHQLKVVVALHNPAGHTSELRCKLPIRICMPSITRLNEDNEMVGTVLPSDQVSALENAAPPGYDAFQYDQVYSDLDYHHLTTPATSAPSTPANVSRSSSAANLAALDGARDSQVSANTLQNSLNRLANPLINRRTQPSSSSLQERGEQDRNTTSHPLEGVAGPSPDFLHLEYNNDELSRIPSYNTAVHTRTTTPASTGLPSYDTATSRPPSPQNPSPQSSSPQGTSPGVQRPPEASSRPGTSSRRVNFSQDTRGSHE